MVARSTNQVDVEFLPKGLHDIGQIGMSRQLKESVAAVDPSQYDAIVMGYALCSNGLVGLAAGSIPIVLPRAHDCITLLLGSKERYRDYFQGHPGAYYKTAGWIERGDDLAQYQQDSVQQTSGMNMAYEELVAKYGEDNAKFLYEQLGDMTSNYDRLTFIEMGIEPDDRFERRTQEEAQRQGWTYEKLQGDMRLIRELVDGPWDDERFLVVRPGQQIAASFDESIVKTEAADATPPA